MYHIHGGPHAELQQGLYGARLVIKKGERLPATTERFELGTTYRLRFLHISTTDVKTVRLLKNGKPVQWRPLARDGATLPTHMRTAVEASLRTDVGQTVDMQWMPTAPGIYVLEVATAYLGTPGPPIQRVAFGVGAVSDDALRIATTGTARLLDDPSSEMLQTLVGTYGDRRTEIVSVWNSTAGLKISRTVANVESPPVALMPLANGTFVPFTTERGLMREVVPLVPYRFDGTSITVGSDGSARRATRLVNYTPDAATLVRYAGRYRGLTLMLNDGILTVRVDGGTTARRQHLRSLPTRRASRRSTCRVLRESARAGPSPSLTIARRIA